MMMNDGEREKKNEIKKQNQNQTWTVGKTDKSRMNEKNNQTNVSMVCLYVNGEQVEKKNFSITPPYTILPLIK